MAAKKRQDLPKPPGSPAISEGGPGGNTALWMMATPIGNLGDLSVRAREILASVDAVLCEDTRRTSNLVSALGLSKSLYRLDQHASPRDVSRYVERMAAGEVFAFVSDAGTPGVSDPGARLAAAAYAAGLGVSPVPGASAVTAILSVAGWEETAFAFRGFFPRRDGERRAEIASAMASGTRVQIWFEAPGRIEDTLTALAEQTPDAEVVAAKELTKLHEKIYKGNIKEVTSHIQSALSESEKAGEWVFAVRFAESSTGANVGEGESWEKTLQSLLNCGVSASTAAREVSQSFGVAKNSAYKRALELAESQISAEKRGKNFRG